MNEKEIRKYTKELVEKGYFYDRKCNSWCEKELNGANVEYLMASGV